MNDFINKCKDNDIREALLEMDHCFIIIKLYTIIFVILFLIIVMIYAMVSCLK